MLNVDELKYCMKKTLYSLGISLLLCLAACENGEAPVLGAIIIDKVTTETITCHVEVVASNIVDYGFYYGTSPTTSRKRKQGLMTHQQYMERLSALLLTKIITLRPME